MTAADLAADRCCEQTAGTSAAARRFWLPPTPLAASPRHGSASRRSAGPATPPTAGCASTSGCSPATPSTPRTRSAATARAIPSTWWRPSAPPSQPAARPSAKRTISPRTRRPPCLRWWTPWPQAPRGARAQARLPPWTAQAFAQAAVLLKLLAHAQLPCTQGAHPAPLAGGIGQAQRGGEGQVHRLELPGRLCAPRVQRRKGGARSR